MKVVGITACPTGIAHTYMAQEALEKECKRRGFDVKIETQGAYGPENELTQEEVDEAAVAIIAVGVVILSRSWMMQLLWSSRTRLSFLEEKELKCLKRSRGSLFGRMYSVTF